MILDAATGLPGYGVFPANVKRRFINRTGAATAIGQLVQLDMKASDAAVDSVTLGDEGSVWANLIAPDVNAFTSNASSYWAMFGVCQEVFADNATGFVMLQGFTPALVGDGGTSSKAIGLPVVGLATGQFDSTCLATERILGVLQEAGPATATAAGVLTNIFFCGDGSLGIFDC